MSIQNIAQDIALFEGHVPFYLVTKAALRINTCFKGITGVAADVWIQQTFLKQEQLQQQPRSQQFNGMHGNSNSTQRRAPSPASFIPSASSNARRPIATSRNLMNMHTFMGHMIPTSTNSIGHMHAHPQSSGLHGSTGDGDHDPNGFFGTPPAADGE